MSDPSIAAQVTALTRMTVVELRDKWFDVFGEPTTQRHKQYLIKRIAWEIQRRDSGQELSPEALKRLDELQDEFRNSPPETWFKGARHNRESAGSKPSASQRVRPSTSPKPGTVLARQYKGQQITVRVLGDREFQWNDQVYRSLSAVAAAVTGSHCSGVAFFGLKKKQVS